MFGKDTVAGRKKRLLKTELSSQLDTWSCWDDVIRTLGLNIEVMAKDDDRLCDG